MVPVERRVLAVSITTKDSDWMGILAGWSAGLRATITVALARGEIVNEAPPLEQ